LRLSFQARVELQRTARARRTVEEMRGIRRLETRVIAGELKGRALAYPRDPSLRPTMQRTKASVFDALGERIRGSVFVDLYAAAGGIGIEALSRGAAGVHFVERNPEALRCLEENLARCRAAPARAVVHRAAVIEFLRGGALLEIDPDVIWADPPYEGEETLLLLEFLGAVRYPVKALLLVEHRRGAVPENRWDGFDVLQTRDFGQSRVTYARLKGDGS
jgi:16S rRNA (guanine(966)-N(2))-methyltransferase RsmD